jgi:hypothetical protein
MACHEDMAMTDKDTLFQARNDMLAVLDEKLANMPEWRAFRAMDRALGAMSEAPAPEPNLDHGPVNQQRVIRRRGRTPDVPTYVELALKAVEAKGSPLPTPDIIEFITQRRPVDPDSEKARINIQSGLSRDKRIKSIPWRGGRAWWFADRKAPHVNSAGTGATQ